jgi:hypothetical protein
MTFPATLDDVQKFEEDNKQTINVFCLSEGMISMQDGNALHSRNGMINLLYLEEGD